MCSPPPTSTQIANWFERNGNGKRQLITWRDFGQLNCRYNIFGVVSGRLCIQLGLIKLKMFHIMFRWCVVMSVLPFWLQIYMIKLCFPINCNFLFRKKNNNGISAIFAINWIKTESYCVDYSNNQLKSWLHDKYGNFYCYVDNLLSLYVS